MKRASNSSGSILPLFCLKDYMPAAGLSHPLLQGSSRQGITFDTETWVVAFPFYMVITADGEQSGICRIVLDRDLDRGAFALICVWASVRRTQMCRTRHDRSTSNKSVRCITSLQWYLIKHTCFT